MRQHRILETFPPARFPQVPPQDFLAQIGALFNLFFNETYRMAEGFIPARIRFYINTVADSVLFGLESLH
jgi:hypothetical protein